MYHKNINKKYILLLLKCTIVLQKMAATGPLPVNLTDFVTVFTGLSDVPGEAMVKLYCPKCQDVYTPKSSRHHHTDGAYFGTGFPHMLFMVHPEYRPKRPANQFVPR